MNIFIVISVTWPIDLLFVIEVKERYIYGDIVLRLEGPNKFNELIFVIYYGIF